MRKHNTPSLLVSLIGIVLQFAFIAACIALAVGGVVVMFTPSGQ